MGLLSEPPSLVHPAMHAGQQGSRHQTEAERERLALSLQPPGCFGHRVLPLQVVGPGTPGDRLQ